MTKNVKRATLVLALTPLLVAPAGVAVAAAATGGATGAATAPLTSTVAPASTDPTTTTTTTHTDAPPASASAVAAKVDGVITIGETSATAGNNSGTAHAEALDILGTRVSGGDGTGSGNLFATPSQGDQIGDLEIAPWSAKVTPSSAGSQSQAEAALAHAGLLGELQIWLLHSQSQATWTPDASHGHSESDGAEANLAGQLDVKVLHAETDSNGKGSSAVLVVNGNGVLTSDQTGNQCVIDADPLVKVLCLQAAGGSGSGGTTTAAATVADVTSQSGLPEIVASGTKSAGGKVAAPAASTTSNQRGPLPHTNGPSSSSGLPFTGSESALVAAIGALLTAMGAWIMTVTGGRRRSSVVA